MQPNAYRKAASATLCHVARRESSSTITSSISMVDGVSLIAEKPQAIRLM